MWSIWLFAIYFKLECGLPYSLEFSLGLKLKFKTNEIDFAVAPYLIYEDYGQDREI